MRRTGRWILALLVIVVIVMVTATIIGTRLSPDHVASRTLTMSAPVDTVWALISDFEGQPSWRDGLSDVRPSASAGRTDVWEEVYTNGDVMSLATTERTAPTRLVRTIADADAMFSGRWEFDLAPAGAGSRLTITEHGRVPNPFFRFVARFLIGHTSQIEAFLRDLGKRADPSP